MNQDAATIEKVETFIQQSMILLNACYGGFECPVNYTELVLGYSEYMTRTINTFKLEKAQIDIYRPYVWDKFEQIDKLMVDIKAQADAWYDDAMLNGRSKPLFRKEQLKTTIYYVPRWPLFVHLVAAIIQMGASAAFHQFQCVSAEKMNTLFKIDLIGIGVMISGSAVAPLYYTYMCNESFQTGMLWLGWIFTLCSIAALVTVVSSKEKGLTLFCIAWCGAVFCTVPVAMHATYFVAEG